MPTAPQGAVVVGGFVNGLGLVRSLASQGQRVAVVTTTPHDVAQYSKHCGEHHHLPDLDENPEALAELLTRRVERWGGRLVIPCNDAAIAGIAAQRERLARSYHLVVSPPEAISTLLDKHRMQVAVDAVGVPSAKRYGPAVPSIVEREDLCFPVLVKPDLGYRFARHFGAKLFVARDRAELATRTAQLRGASLSGQVYDLIPGPDSRIFACCVYMNARGAPHASLTIRKLRQSPPGFGIARVAELVQGYDELVEPTVEIMRQIGCRGLAVAEFKRDPRDGVFRFLEINGRSVVYNTLLQRGGLDSVRLVLAEHSGRHPPRFAPTQWGGIWVHLHADLLRVTLSRRQEQSSPWRSLTAYARPKVFAVWSRRDPAPFLVEWGQSARAAAAAARGGRWSNLFEDRAQPGRRPVTGQW